MITITTDMGKITLGKSVIGTLVMDVIESFDGKVILSDAKGRVHKLAYKLKTMDQADNIEIEQTEDGIDLRVFIILKFGTSIKTTTEKLIADIRSKVTEASGINIGTLSVVVTGMFTTNKVAPRHIEVTG